jgi:hypothetical protein
MMECVRPEKEALGCGKVWIKHQLTEQQHDNQNMGRAAPEQWNVVFRYLNVSLK